MVGEHLVPLREIAEALDLATLDAPGLRVRSDWSGRACLDLGDAAWFVAEFRRGEAEAALDE